MKISKSPNFQFADKVLADVRSSLTIDGFPVLAQYLDPDNLVEVSYLPEIKWYPEHVRESQYVFADCGVQKVKNFVLLLELGYFVGGIE